jgi:G3E family GTPase
VAPARLPIILLTGFLGSGKTTLLRHALAGPLGADTAVLVNELGAIGLDHHLLMTATETTLVLANGCVCCSIRDDLIGSLSELFWQRLRREVPPFARVVIETTGLADPRHVVAGLADDSLVAERYRLSSVVCAVDGRDGEGVLDRHGEAMLQAASADLLVVTKTDVAESDAVARLTSRLRDVNPLAVMQESDRGQVSAEILFQSRREAAISPPKARQMSLRSGGRSAAFSATHAMNIATFALRFPAPPELAALNAALQRIIARLGERLLRVKGLVRVAGGARPLLIEAVGTRISPPEPVAAKEGDWLVFIVIDSAPAEIQAQFMDAGIATARDP